MPYRVWLSVMLIATVLLGVGVRFVEGPTGCDTVYDRYAHATGPVKTDRYTEAAYRHRRAAALASSKLISLAP